MKILMLIVIINCCLIVNAFRKNTLVPGKKYELDCKGKRFANVSLTAYYPDYTSKKFRRNYLDSRGKKLRTLQDFLENRFDYVTLAMDEKLKIPYGTAACSPELNQYFGRRIKLQVRDDGDNLFKTGYARADICVRTESDSYESEVNRMITLVF